MGNAKRRYIDERTLKSLIIKKYRSGQTVKAIVRDFKHYTIEHERGPLPSGYVDEVIYEHVMEFGL